MKLTSNLLSKLLDKADAVKIKESESSKPRYLRVRSVESYNDTLFVLHGIEILNGITSNIAFCSTIVLLDEIENIETIDSDQFDTIKKVIYQRNRVF